MDEQAIPILRVANAADAVTWYERLGFTKEWEHRFASDCPAFVSIARITACVALLCSTPFGVILVTVHLC